jgi:hypothetical protein
VGRKQPMRCCVRSKCQLSLRSDKSFSAHRDFLRVGRDVTRTYHSFDRGGCIKCKDFPLTSDYNCEAALRVRLISLVTVSGERDLARNKHFTLWKNQRLMQVIINATASDQQCSILIWHHNTVHMIKTMTSARMDVVLLCTNRWLEDDRA